MMLRGVVMGVVVKSALLDVDAFITEALLMGANDSGS